jgi:hypothetical protein
MKHLTCDVPDVPAAPVLMDRRKTPDRRIEWRGGRRDSDWVNRPLDAWPTMEAKQRRLTALRKALSVLHLW